MAKNKVKIGIDASRYSIDTPTGVEWYSYHLINHLIPLLGRDHQKEFIFYTQRETKFEEELPFNCKQLNLKFPRLWTLIRLSWEMLVKPVDLLFIPSHILPLWLPKKTVVTVHDVAFKVKELSNEIIKQKEKFDILISILPNDIKAKLIEIFVQEKMVK